MRRHSPQPTSVLQWAPAARRLPAMEIARRSRFIAVESVVVGMGLSLMGMAAAALGYLTPVQGALIQEAIDVVVIFNALRALAGQGRFKR